MAELHPACVYVPVELLCEKPELLKPFADNGAEIVAALPAVLFGEKEEESLRALLGKAYELGIRTVSAGNLGLAMMAGQEGFRIRGDLDLAVMNGYTLSSLAAAGFRSAMLSPELTLGDVRAMPKPMDTELVVYGRLPVMVTQTCLLKESAGRCSCTTPGQMADTHGGVWPVTKHFGCRNTVWASRKLWLGDVTNEWIDLGLWAVRMCFSTESARECLEVANSYIQGTHYKPNGITRGLYYRGVL
jgi:U32 family peptidase